jgi:uncharacterized membrane protein YphA (DoxX/SURF4 family)
MEPEPGASLLVEQTEDGLGLGGALLLVLRVAVGGAAVAAGALALRDRVAAEADAAAWGLPAADLVALVVPIALVALGLALILGLASRLAALLLLLLGLALVATAGRVDGGLVLVATSAFSVLALAIVARGGGDLQLLDAIDPDA